MRRGHRSGSAVFVGAALSQAKEPGKPDRAGPLPGGDEHHQYHPAGQEYEDHGGDEHDPGSHGVTLPGRTRTRQRRLGPRGVTRSGRRGDRQAWGTNANRWRMLAWTSSTDRVASMVATNSLRSKMAMSGLVSSW
jgi:hypothetical protein